MTISLSCFPFRDTPNACACAVIVQMFQTLRQADAKPSSMCLHRKDVGSRIVCSCSLNVISASSQPIAFQQHLNQRLM